MEHALIDTPPDRLPVAVVQAIADRRRDGASLRQIAQALNDDAVPTARGGAAWHPATIRSVLVSRRGQVALARPGRACPPTTGEAHASVGRLIRSLRLYHGLTMAEVAASVGISKPTLRHIETGRPTTAAPPVFAAILRTVGASVEEVAKAIDDAALLASVTRWMDAPSEHEEMAHAA